MAKFRDSTTADTLNDRNPSEAPTPAPERRLGDIIAETRNLTADQIERILVHQRETGLRFGEASIALGFVSTDDVLFALAQQFDYPYSPETQRQDSPELVTLHQPFSRHAEAFRTIRSQITMRVFGQADGRRGLAIISPQTGDGKTYFAANLAVTMAQLGGRTLLVDADLRGPRQHEVFNIPNAAGLSGILVGRSEAQVVQAVLSVPGLFVLPVGIVPPNPLELIERPAFALLMRELCSKFDHVIVDTAAAQFGSDAAVVAARCGAALVVARRNASRVAALQELVATVAESPAKLAGVIYNEF